MVEGCTVNCARAAHVDLAQTRRAHPRASRARVLRLTVKLNASENHRPSKQVDKTLVLCQIMVRLARARCSGRPHVRCARTLGCITSLPQGFALCAFGGILEGHKAAGRPLLAPGRVVPLFGVSSVVGVAHALENFRIRALPCDTEESHNEDHRAVDATHARCDHAELSLLIFIAV